MVYVLSHCIIWYGSDFIILLYQIYFCYDVNGDWVFTCCTPCVWLKSFIILNIFLLVIRMAWSSVLCQDEQEQRNHIQLLQFLRCIFYLASVLNSWWLAWIHIALAGHGWKMNIIGSKRVILITMWQGRATQSLNRE